MVDCRIRCEGRRAPKTAHGAGRWSFAIVCKRLAGKKAAGVAVLTLIAGVIITVLSLTGVGIVSTLCLIAAGTVGTLSLIVAVIVRILSLIAARAVVILSLNASFVVLVLGLALAAAIVTAAVGLSLAAPVVVVVVIVIGNLSLIASTAAPHGAITPHHHVTLVKQGATELATGLGNTQGEKDEE